MPDIFTATARTIFDEAVADMSSAIEGASPEALNWKPGGEDTNSIAVLAVHSMHSTRSWFSVALGLPLPDRDRDSEFLATTPDASSLLGFLASMQDDCRQLLAQGAVEDWSVMRETHARPNADAEKGTPAAWALLHALEHLREHAGQMLLTRQLWNRRS